MRRSAAPSQLTSKKPRFTSPVSRNDKVADEGSNEVIVKERSVKEVLSLINTGCSANNTKETGKIFCPSVNKAPHRSSASEEDDNHNRHSAQEQINQFEEAEILPEKENELATCGRETVTTTAAPQLKAVAGKPRPKLKPFRTPSMMSQNGAVTVKQKNIQYTQSSVAADTDDTGPQPVYFSIVWCKLSKKKHKKWEGDAVLVTKGRSVTIMDLEGKEIGKGTGYKTSELAVLGEGNTLVIGGKEIEIMGKLSAEDFKTGKCFNSGFTKEESAEPIGKLPTESKPFVKPGRHSASSPAQGASVCTAPVVKPKHDPTAPGALVMPRPTKAHQWEHNKSGQPVIDVVVDPYLSQHLRPHQREGTDFLYQCVMDMKAYAGQGAILADEMGLGKTLQCICLIWTLLKQGPYGGKPTVKKVLVVTPGSLVKNWLKEFKKWLGTERLKVYAVTQDNKVQDFKNLPHYPVCIISYEMLVRTIETIRQVKFDLIVCDEGHRLKNSNIKTTSLLSSLPCTRRVVLTGTPVQNDLQELYSIVHFCNPGILGTPAAFRRVYEDPILASREPQASEDTRILGQERASELSHITAMFILRRTSDINNKYLPPKVELVLFCKPSGLQLTLYRQMTDSRVLRSCLSCQDTGQHLMCISALKKLCNHPVLLHDNALKAENGSEQELYRGLYQHYPGDFDPGSPLPEDGGKLAVLQEILDALYDTRERLVLVSNYTQEILAALYDTRERVVLVSNYTQTLDVFEKLCSTKGYKYLRLDGQTPTDKRQQLVESFNSRYGQEFVFLLSCKAGGVGLNLIGASRLILYDIDWNPANDLQAMARVWRDGQTRPVYIYRLLTTGTIEEKMYQRQVSKQGLSGVIVDARASSSKQCFSPDELKDLFTLQEDTLCATHDLLGCVDCEDDHSVPGAELTRSCQLQKVQASKKNLCMDELLEWKHITGPSVDLTTVDPVLSNSCHGDLDNVTFAFWNESNSQSAVQEYG